MKNRLKIIRKAKKLTQDRIAEALDISTAQVSRWENDIDGIPSQRLPELARVYGCRIGDIFEDDEIPVVGKVGAGAEIYPVDDHAPGDGFDFIKRPAGIQGAAVAVEVTGDSMVPIAEDGWRLVYARNGPTPISDLINRLCVIRLVDGRVLVKRILKGSQPGRYHLFSSNAPMIEDVQIEWAARVMSIVPR